MGKEICVFNHIRMTKTETKITEEKIREFKYCKVGEAVYYKMVCDTHKASCQRFLGKYDTKELRKIMLYLNKVKEGKGRNFKIFFIELTKDVLDNRNAIKKYDEVGI